MTQSNSNPPSPPSGADNTGASEALRLQAEALAVDMTNETLPQRIEIAMRHLSIYAAQEATKARLDELTKVMAECETGDVSIWVYKWAKNRRGQLTAHKESKE